MMMFDAVLLLPILVALVAVVAILAVIRGRRRPQVYYHDGRLPPPLPRRAGRSPLVAIGLGCGGVLALVVLLIVGLMVVRWTAMDSMDRAGIEWLPSPAEPPGDPLTPMVQDARIFKHASIESAVVELAWKVETELKRHGALEPGAFVIRGDVFGVGRALQQRPGNAAIFAQLPSAERRRQRPVELSVRRMDDQREQTAWGERRVGTLQLLSGGQVVQMAHYDTRNWVVSPPTGDWVTGGSPLSQTGDAAWLGAIDAAAWRTVPRVRPHLSNTSMDDRDVHRLIVQAIQQGRWRPVDTFQQQITLSGGRFHAIAVLLDASPRSLGELAGFVDEQQPSNWGRLPLPLAGLALVVLVLCLLLNALTRGYQRRRAVAMAGTAAATEDK